MFYRLIFSGLLLGLVYHGFANAQKLPRENVVQVPAISDGLSVSNIFQTNMVLQRNKPLRIWGWAKPGEKVTVSFAGQQATAKAADDRNWQVILKPIAADNKPQNLTVSGESKKLSLENILVGDVWILGGQSNMEFPISKVENGNLEIVSANFPEIRLLTMPKGNGFDSVRSFERLHEWSSWSNRHFRKGDWEVCSPETVKEFSAIGYVFGRRLHMATRVPIGLIDASIGGTTVETWTPEPVVASIEGRETREMFQEWAEKIAAFDPQADLQERIVRYENRVANFKAKGQPVPSNLKRPRDLQPGPAGNRNRPGYCYASVIQPLEGLSIKGAVFHQGFNNCFSGSAGARMYYQVFGQLITAWRTAFQDAQMPFCIISLCTAGEPQTRENFAKPMYDVGALIREAQYQTFRDFYDAGDKGIGFVSCFDLRKSWYHPQIKIPAGERAAKWALVAQYEVLQGRDSDQYWLPPSIKKVERVDGTIRLTMSTAIKTKDDSDGKLFGFAIAGNDRRFHPADVQWYTDGTVDNRNRPKYQRDVLVLSSPSVSEPVHFRHAWARNPMTNIVGGQTVPLATQRSDDWLLEETPISMPLPPNTDLKSQARRIRGVLTKELELTDVKRRIQEAEATIAELKPILEKATAKSQQK